MTKSFKMSSHQQRFRDKGILPTKRLIIVFLFLYIPIGLASFRDLGWISFILLNSGFLLISLFDVKQLPRRRELSCSRDIPYEIERGLPFEVTVSVSNGSKHSIAVQLIDDLPSSFTRPFPLHLQLEGNSNSSITYTSHASIRGSYPLEKVYVRYRSRLGLWEKQMVFIVSSEAKVIPDLSEVRHYLVEVQKMLLHEGRKVRKRRIGSGEFAHVRSYVIGDDPRKVNWHQTAKRSEIMTNIYEPEHGKYITILIDCSRTMGVELKKTNRLERSIEAALTIAAVTLKQGDYVSVLVFSNKIKKYIPPGKGMSHLQLIIQNIYAVQSDPVEANYESVFNYLEQVQKRRSLMLLFSDLEGFLVDQSQLTYLKFLRKRNLLLLLGISDPMIEKWINHEPEQSYHAIIKSLAQKQKMDRKNAMREWDKKGLQMIEALEENLVADAISRYLEIMNRDML